ncbi:MAG: hypothetical protein QG646_3038 [Euryarchaeota archaeon]|nr:hypothetical protein [Euryarchaeota archaeon]
MEVKNPVTASVRTTVRTGFELLTIAFAILLPLALTAFALMDAYLPKCEIFICGLVGTLIWWRISWFVFWYVI